MSPARADREKLTSRDHAATLSARLLRGSSASMTEDGEHQLREGGVHTGNDADHDQDEDDCDRGVGDQFLAGRPDHLPEFGPDLPHEYGRARPLRLRRSARLNRPSGLRATYLSRHAPTRPAGQAPPPAVAGPAAHPPTPTGGGARTPT